MGKYSDHNYQFYFLSPTLIAAYAAITHHVDLSDSQPAQRVSSNASLTLLNSTNGRSQIERWDHYLWRGEDTLHIFPISGTGDRSSHAFQVSIIFSQPRPDGS